MKSNLGKISILTLLVGLLVWQVPITLKQTQNNELVDEMLALILTDQPDKLLKISDSYNRDVTSAMSIVELRCQAYMELNQHEFCLEEARQVYSQWPTNSPSLQLGLILVDDYFSQGETETMAAVLDLLVEQYPTDISLLQKELDYSKLLEKESLVLEAISQRPETNDAVFNISRRSLVAMSYLHRVEYDKALTALGEQYPSANMPLTTQWNWIDFRVNSLAKLQRMDEIEETFQKWKDNGANTSLADIGLAFTRLNYGILSATKTPDELQKEIIDKLAVTNNLPEDLTNYFYARLTESLPLQDQGNI